VTAQKKPLLNFLLTVQDATLKRPIFDHQLFQKNSGFASRRRIIRIGLYITFCWVLSGDIAGAQQSSKPSATNPVPTPIPLSDIASQGESASDSLRDIATSLSTDQLTATVEKRLPRLTNEIDLRAAEMGKLLASSLPLEFLHFIEVALQRFRSELSAENHDLTERIKTLDDKIAQLDRLSTIWKSTLQLPELARTAPEIPKRVQDLINSIDRTQQAAKSLRERDLTLQGGVLEATARLQIGLSALEQAQANAVRNLFVQDSPPIWRLGVESWQEESHVPVLWRSTASVFGAYIKRHSTDFLLHAFIFLLFLLAVHWLRRRVHKWTEREPSLRRAAPVFDVPVSTAIALSFLITGPTYSLAPFLVRAILGGAVLIPTALILRRLMDPTLFPILNALLVFYFVDQLRLLTAAVPLWGRFIFGAEMLGGTLFLIWLIRSKHLSTVGAKTTKRFGRVIRVATQIGLIVFPATLLANVFGYVNFANLLGNGALRSAYVAAVLYAALRIVEGLIIISLEARPLGLMRVVRLNRPMLQRRIFGVAELLAFVWWLSLTLNFFELRTPLITSSEGALRANLTIGSLSISLGQVLVFVVAVWASFLISKLLRFILEGDVYHYWRLERGIPQAISTRVHYVVLLAGFFVGLAALGVDLTKITILAGAFTVGIGFGLQTVINNFVCGLILLFERPIKVGDVVQVGEDVGEVRRIGIRACVIRTVDGSEVIVPNGTIITNKVTNWTFSDRYRAVEVLVSVARGVAPERVLKVLKSVAANHPSLAKEPPPQAYVVSFGPAAVSLQLRAWTDRYEDWIQVRSDLSVAVDEALTRENITVA
jgi:potassium-dependent mechanosensitive channel